ncbi:hypothetical protein SAMD00019534_084540 [Acytostelium subglobosum LB1]|uniref:hypothetical protein n=1 Tax=Acytostelium subglobosum LB1 TaxID=1410327 RepID=UPI000644A2C3|nr:hypothetical protein SAMD00019534_084540 [Acytostelium subglobosum LB1]GAM25279.1 hypothetical protein SAMD00019534_084540 [Acytostelium subglobosum LB1]|eukprot:XP_012751799.1 hypothetical protein SAMD00019534_084540 [Acytostelium subglobosum LB1]
MNCITYVQPGNGFMPNFQLFQRSNVNGPVSTINPIFAWLKSGCGPSSPTLIATDLISWTPVLYNDIEGNFAKFLISKSGKLVRRYSSTTMVQDIAGDISDLLNE